VRDSTDENWIEAIMTVKPRFEGRDIDPADLDPETGETKETRRFPKPVLTLARRVKVLIEKGDKAAEKAEQFYKAAGIHIKEIKEQSDDWETIVREQCGLGRSRAYELMAIADGKTTLEKVRDRSNRSSKISHAKKSAVQRTEPEPGSEEYERDRKECVALAQKVNDANQERARWLINHPATPGQIIEQIIELFWLRNEKGQARCVNQLKQILAGH
jgi:hypothetical protein